jgi:hypothetical protein
MKKYIVSLLALAATTVVVNASSFSLTSAANTLTNVLGTVVSGPVKILQVSVTTGAQGLTNAPFYDMVTNSQVNIFTYTNAAYTNQVSYPTNLVWTYTDFWTHVTSLTNLVLVDIVSTNAATTNFYPVRLALSAAAGTTYTVSGNFYFMNGMWFTNTSQGTVTLTVLYQ